MPNLPKTTDSHNSQSQLSQSILTSLNPTASSSGGLPPHHRDTSIILASSGAIGDQNQKLNSTTGPINISKKNKKGSSSGELLDNAGKPLQKFNIPVYTKVSVINETNDSTKDAVINNNSKSTSKSIFKCPTPVKSKIDKIVALKTINANLTRSAVRCFPNLSLLQGTEHLFMRKCSQFPDILSTFQPIASKRVIMNSSGNCIYYSGQIINKWSWKLKNEFTIQVVDHNGRTVIIISGVQMFLGFTANATVYQSDGIVLGTIVQDFCDAGYNVKDKEGRLEFRLRGPCYGSCTPCVFWSACCIEHFEIDLQDGVTETGLITTYWKDTHPEYSGTFGIHFPIALENRQKGLLFGASFLIHYQYYRRGGNGVWIFILVCLALVGGLIYPVGKHYGLL